MGFERWMWWFNFLTERAHDSKLRAKAEQEQAITSLRRVLPICLRKTHFLMGFLARTAVGLLIYIKTLEAGSLTV